MMPSDWRDVIENWSGYPLPHLPDRFRVLRPGPQPQWEALWLASEHKNDPQRSVFYTYTGEATYVLYDWVNGFYVDRYAKARLRPSRGRYIVSQAHFSEDEFREALVARAQAWRKQKDETVPLPLRHGPAGTPAGRIRPPRTPEQVAAWAAGMGHAMLDLGWVRREYTDELPS